MKIIIDNPSWGAWHNEWGWATGRMMTHLWPNKQAVENWIKSDNGRCSSGYYTPLPRILPQELITATITE